MDETCDKKDISCGLLRGLSPDHGCAAPVTTEPLTATTIVHSLREKAESRPNAIALLFTRGDGEDEILTYGDLDRRARLLASRVTEEVSPHSIVLVPMRSDASSVIALFACLYAGCPCAPVPHPSRNSTTRQLSAILVAAGCAAVVAPSQDVNLETFAGLPIIGEDGTGDLRWAPRLPPEHNLAIVQYTSGSTAEPKGVMLSHANIIANLEMFRIAFGVGAESRFASWLPLFHDMGLATLLMPLHFGVPGALMTPLTFLRRPERWWQMVDRFAATVTGAPNFAFEMSVKRIPPSIISTINLSRLKVAFCGAEPVRRSTMLSFARSFASTGFGAAALFPSYGLAEAVCFVSGAHLVRDDEPDIAASKAASTSVSCGAPAVGSIIRIVDPRTLTLCAERQVGEVWLSGPHVGAGYLGLPEATYATFEARLGSHPSEKFLRTGDLGYLDTGALTIVGRIKDVIIYRGNNIHAIDVERVVATCHPSFGPDGAAFAWEEGEAEHVVLVHEAARGFSGLFEEAMQFAAIDAVAQHHGVRLLDLVLVRSGIIPRTSSGKVRRDACRTLYAHETLRIIGRTRSPPAQ